MATKKKATKRTKATSATEQELHEAQTSGIPKATPAIERDINVWRKFNAIIKGVEPKVDAAKKKVAAAILGLEVEVIETKNGPLKLQTKQTVNWEAFARAHVSESVINAIDWEAFARHELEPDHLASAEPTWGPLNWEALVRTFLDHRIVEERKADYGALAQFTSRSEPFLSAPSWFRKAA